MRADQLIALAIARQHRMRLMEELAQTVAAIDEEIASALPQLGLPSSLSAGLELLGPGEVRGDHEVTPVMNFTDIGQTTDEERAEAAAAAAAAAAAEATEERALVPYGMGGAFVGWRAPRPGYSSFIVSELQRLLDEGPMFAAFAGATVRARAPKKSGKSKAAAKRKKAERRAREAREKQLEAQRAAAAAERAAAASELSSMTAELSQDLEAAKAAAKGMVSGLYGLFGSSSSPKEDESLYDLDGADGDLGGKATKKSGKKAKAKAKAGGKKASSSRSSSSSSKGSKADGGSKAAGSKGSKAAGVKGAKAAGSSKRGRSKKSKQARVRKGGKPAAVEGSAGSAASRGAVDAEAPLRAKRTEGVVEEVPSPVAGAFSS
eukprot:Transcript_26601.p2 GENE.Transcript_26601~~Transcript_26601.p2  ORF type:complete len:377 (-),score=182.86 Transcript_26601:1022-2152(-)